jgi:cation-transporting ATPase 13A1
MAHHYWNAYQAIVSARELAQEVAQDQRAAVCLEVRVKRFCEKTGRKRWMTLPATALLPGDVFRLNKNTTTLPVDALLLEGTAVTNEAVLTGETVAQSKVPLADDSPEMRLDMLGQHRSSILFAGTFLQHCSGKLTCLALRTGSYSSRGDLVRALQRSRVGAVSSAETEQDGLRLILCLSLIACYTCISFWRQPSPQDTKPGQVFRKVLHCCRILMATIPSDLPMIISSIAHSCAHRLKHEADVVCSEPAALLTASSVNHILFDKTGTMTTDTQSLAMVRTRSESEEFLANLVLAGCHSLVDLNGDMIGDPLDLASFRNSGWNMNDQDSRRFSRKVGEQEVSLWQIKTFPFDASRRTSSSLVLVHSGDSSKLFKLVKGSPEKMVDLVAVDGKWFTNTTKELGEDGYRIVAMGAQDVSDDSAVVKQLFPLGLPCTRLSSKVIKRAQRAATRLIVRDSFECPGFSFCGFSCFSAVIRPSTPRVIAELKRAKIGVSMLTGDSVDAAVSVARRCRLIDEPNDIAVFLLDIDPAKKLLGWRKLGIDGGSNKPFESWESVTVAKHGGCTLIATGKAVEYLLTKDYLSPEEKNIQLMLPNFAIFARATPNQKVLVTRAIKNSGLKVLMCGTSRITSPLLCLNRCLLCFFGTFRR